MPRFSFDIANSHGTSSGEAVSDLEGLGAARAEAVRRSGEILQRDPARFWGTGEWSCTVRDETGLILFVLHVFATGAPATLSP